MTRAVLIILTILAAVSCRRSGQLKESEKESIILDIQHTFYDCYNDVKKSGLIAELGYLDKSSKFFWVPPGYANSISYDSVVMVVKRNAAKYRSVDFSLDTLQIIPLSCKYATYSARMHSTVTDTSGSVSTLSLVESGTLIKRQGDWKLLSGQTAIIGR